MSPNRNHAVLDRRRILLEITSMKLAAIAAVLRARPQAIIRELKAGPDFRPDFAEFEG